MKLPKIFSKAPIAIDAIKDKKYAWCSCGLSENQPFCNGAHKGFEFTPKIFTKKEDKKIYLCN
ncbi:MAG: CDGSH iron-sulfur domain-containing protein, partial [Flavobacteriaceae bacterium]|nr:CDGSH iron-sulfur domain-containing protein [Flavobacteriaceae bacterium]